MDDGQSGDLDGELRLIKSEIKGTVENLSWERWKGERNLADTANVAFTFSTATVFTVNDDFVGASRAVAILGRRVRANITGSVLYGTITVASFSSPTTTVTVVWDSGAMDATLTEISFGPELRALSVSSVAQGVADRIALWSGVNAITSNANLTFDGNSFVVNAAGPHAIGGPAAGATRLALVGTYTATSTNSAHVSVGARLTTASGSSVHDHVQIQAFVTTATAADIYTVISSLKIVEPAITLGAGSSVTTTATLYVASVANEGTNNYSGWFAAGPVRLDGALFFSGDSQIGFISGGSLKFGEFASVVPGAFTEHMRLTDLGTLLVGTTQNTGAGGGDVVVRNNGAFRFIDAAGATSANFAILGNPSDNMLLRIPSNSSSFEFQHAGLSSFRMRHINAGPVFQINGEVSSDISGPGANNASLYLIDNGSGKTQLKVRFNTASAIVLATEP